MFHERRLSWVTNLPLSAMTHRVVIPLDSVITLPFIRVTGGVFLGIAVHMFLPRLSIRMLAHPQPALPPLPADGAHDGGTIILIGPMPASFVGAAARRSARVAVFVAFFPPHSEPSPRSPSPRPATPLSLTLYTRWLGAVCATDGHTAVRAPVPQLRPSRRPPYTRHPLTTPHDRGPDYCPQKGCLYRGYTSADSYGSDNRQTHACAPEIPAPLVWTRHISGIASLWDENVSRPTPYFPAHLRVR